MRIILPLVTGLVALGVPASGAAGGDAVRPPSPRKCVLLPKSQQPKPLRHAAGTIVVTIPATTCNTETGATGHGPRR